MPESSLQLNTVPGSLALKLKVALRLDAVEPFAGPAVIVVSGGVVSTSKVRDRVSLSLPAASMALRDKVWVPSGSGDV